ncbi:sugar phosphate isomerase/epimerase [Stieleria sp. TO1_6]|uniref:sugar phosphate isomerase/epimerase family protein n=1 Tax=Stieleria tagensis TaxID=2956795 RepID=UPI00209AED22|nr:sugar phosphate isomerase/epimerase family protein [Stieleria tagensis]MCO8122724.1 sugar phosphate isomerase/epimerase [Stieleria tagensis]
MRRRTALQTMAALGAATWSVSNRQSLMAEKPATDDSTPWLRKTLKVGMIKVEGTLEDKFRAAKAAGFEGVEVNTPGINVDAVNQASKATGLIVDGSVGGSHWNIRHSDPDPAVRADALAKLKQAIKETADVGGDSCLLVVGHGKDGTPEEVYQRSSDNIRAALPTAERYGVSILVENVWNEFLYDKNGDSNQSVQPLADYIDQFDSPLVGLQFDLGNHWKFGDIAQWVRTLGPRIQKLDIKGFSRQTGKFTKVTEGDVDWPAIEAALREINFRGWCAAEVAGGDAARLKEIAENMETALHCSVNQPQKANG